MHPDLLRLASLTDLDTALDKALAERTAARGAVDLATVALREAELARDRVDADMKAAKERERAAHREISEYQTRLQRAEQVLATGAGDPDAAERQRLQCIDIIDRLETEELLAMDAVEGVRPRLDKAVATVSAAAAELADVAAKSPARLASADAEVTRLTAERDAEAAPLPRELAVRYADLRAKKRPPVVRVSGDTCPKCQYVVPAQARADAARGQFPACRGCGRWILFV